jgi:hypothetical protein
VSIDDNRIRDILATASLSGCHLRLTERLDRGEYLAVTTVLGNLGGAWSRKQRAHVFPNDPGEALREITAGGQLPASATSTEGHVQTPPGPHGEPAELAGLTRQKPACGGDPPARAARRAADRELRASAAALLDDPEQVAAMNRALAGASARIQGYSDRNRALLHLQALQRSLTLTDVDTYRGWSTRARQVRKGEKALRIVAPVGRDTDTDGDAVGGGGQQPEPADTDSQHDWDGGDEGDEGDEGDSKRFRMLSLFERSQTDEVLGDEDRVGDHAEAAAERVIAEATEARLAALDGAEAGGL